MKNAWMVLLAVIVVLGVAGCSQHGMYGAPQGDCMMGSCANAPETCAPCGPGLLGGGPNCPCGYPGRCLGHKAPCVIGGAPLGAMQYPYYTTRGPRDFLVGDPQPVGP